MKTKLICCLTVVAVMSMATVSFGAFKPEWRNVDGAGDGLWATAANWVDGLGDPAGHVPDGHWPKVTNEYGGGLSTIDGASYTLYGLDVGKYGYDGQLEITATGSLTMTGPEPILVPAESAGALPNSSLTTSGILNADVMSIGHASKGTFKQLGGTTNANIALFAAPWLGVGHAIGTELHLIDGVVTAGGTEMNTNVNIWIEDGIMRSGAAKDQATLLANLNAMDLAGQIIVDGGAGDAFIGMVNGNVVLGNAANIPEPTSVALLGLGGLAMLVRRRKR